MRLQSEVASTGQLAESRDSPRFSCRVRCCATTSGSSPMTQKAATYSLSAKLSANQPAHWQT